MVYQYLVAEKRQLFGMTARVLEIRWLSTLACAGDSFVAFLV